MKSACLLVKLSCLSINGCFPRRNAAVARTVLQAAARSRLADEARRQMAADLESSGELELPSFGRGPPPPISASAAAVAAVAAGNRGVSTGRRAQEPPKSPPQISPTDTSPVDPPATNSLALTTVSLHRLPFVMNMIASNKKICSSEIIALCLVARHFSNVCHYARASGAEIAALEERHSKEIEAIQAEHKETINGLQAEVKRLANKLVSGDGLDSGKVARLEHELKLLQNRLDAERASHVEEISKLRSASAENIKHLEKIQALQSEKEATQRLLESKDRQLRELDAVQAQLRDREYKLYEANKALDEVKATMSASMSSATLSLQNEVDKLR
eukprot:scaffold313690_cov28-Prasinocladus_malaysianus.AAC.2